MKEGSRDSAERRQVRAKRPNFGLKEALAAAMLATTPNPGIAQSPIPRIENHAEDLLQRSRRWLQREVMTHETTRAIVGDTPQMRERKKILDETAQHIADPRYQSALRMLEKEGADLQNFIAIVSPSVLLDEKNLEARLSRIPKGIRGNIDLQPEDLEDARAEQFQREGLAEIASLYGAAGIRLEFKILNDALDSERRSPGISQIIIDLDVRSAGKVSAGTVIAKLSSATIVDVASLRNTAFTTGLEELTGMGYALLDILPPGQYSKRLRKLFAERVADPRLRFVMEELKDEGMISDGLRYLLLKLEPENYSNPLFLKNAKLVRPLFRSEGSMLLARYQRALVEPELESLYAAAPEEEKGSVLGFVQRALEKHDRDALFALASFQKKYEGSGVQARLIYQLDGVRLRDPEYMKVYESWIQEMQTYVRGESAGDGGGGGDLPSDEVFVKAKTGKTLEQIRRTLRGYVDTIRQAEKTDRTLFHILNVDSVERFTEPVLQMNLLHNATPGARLKVLEGLDAKTLFEVMVRGGADAYLSTFRLIYNGNGYTGKEIYNSFRATSLREKKSMYDFVQSMKPSREDFSKFLLALSRHGYLDEFLTDVGTPEQQTQVFSEYLFDMKKQFTQAQVVSWDNLLGESKNESLRTFILQNVRAILEDTPPVNQVNVDRRVLAGLFLAQHFATNVDMPEWAQGSVDAYKQYFPNITTLESAAVFRDIQGVASNIQHHVFYDDRKEKGGESTWDGHHSFRNFIHSVGGRVRWDKAGKISSVTGKNIVDKGDYVVITQQSSVRGRQIIMYANKPDRVESVVHNTFQDLTKEQSPHVVVHRGHSFHAHKTVSILKSDVSLVNFGSCGGVNEIAPALRLAPGAHIMGTTSVGTMLVNDPVLRAINAALLRDGRIDWPVLRKQLNAYFEKIGGVPLERWTKYVLPHENRTARLIAAMNELVDDDGSFDTGGIDGGGN